MACTEKADACMYLSSGRSASSPRACLLGNSTARWDPASQGPADPSPSYKERCEYAWYIESVKTEIDITMPAACQAKAKRAFAELTLVRSMSPTREKSQRGTNEH